MNFIKLLRKSYVNLRGWKLKEKYLVIESDDWGSVRIRDKQAYKELNAQGLNLQRSRFTRLDSLERPDDLTALYEVLNSVKDSENKSARFTPNYLVANPDFRRIKESNFQEYFSLSLEESYRDYGFSEENRKILQEGLNEGFFRPQYHGKEHLHPYRWLQTAQNCELERTAAAHFSLPGLDFKDTSCNYTRYGAAFDYNNEEERDFINANAVEGLRLFESYFGYKAVSFAPSQSIMDDELLMHLKQHGIILNKAGFRYLPKGLKDSKVAKQEYWGFSEQTNMLTSRSNANFEPSASPKSDWIKQCMDEIEVAFFFSKPAVISSHRVNYIGALDEHNRRDNLKLLKQLLQQVLKKYPDVIFCTAEDVKSRMFEDFKGKLE